MKTLAPARPGLTAGEAARLIREAGVPCVTLVPDEAAAAAIPAAPREEGLRVVEGSMPVRIAYPIPPEGDDARPAAGQVTRDADAIAEHRGPPGDRGSPGPLPTANRSPAQATRSQRSTRCST